MKTRIILIMLIFSFTAVIFADGNPELKTRQVSAKKAMLLSSLFPGAGQYYADKSSFTTYLFPILEIGLWTGYLVYYNKGLDKEEEYEDYADEHYNRQYQYNVQYALQNNPEANPITYANHFRLDGIEVDEDGNLIDITNDNTQHFYEDIGKYSKYFFGWIDWYEVYATTDGINFAEPLWIWDENDIAIGVSEPNYPDSDFYVGDEAVFHIDNGLYSRFINDYIEMRNEAEDFYDMGRYFSYGILANHIASALDANRLARKKNAALAKNWNIKVSPVLVNNQVSPAIFISAKF
ncbi:MAG: hypothetical protein K9N09_00885 [Candidatus Cloacimonetes bacterium]|nr:hypothetical protein [Candidatus Cloacimonadota bacterium]MCF7813029.1 hypothetical protein [Candidatus Cloacimonadota bacterium]MCF7867230.1 hypothetical protein [Candidatus Cloacimonadota bacterium]MCF7882674.1 hypothetical protein [Candidatus Cloacimonadota bacterium]